MSRRVKIEVFYSRTCPNCPAQKKLAKKFESEEVKVKITDVAKKKGRAKNHGVRAVPTTVISGPAIDQKMGFTGVMKEERLEKAIKLARGEITFEEFKPEGVVDKIKGLFS